ncbi:MAG: precorrin-3B C(17)-methyltransferase [Thermoleophilia bacterium]|jgi:cobalt-precorrin 5A hydrolase/precorrin-3B C17-methyltransferase
MGIAKASRNKTRPDSGGPDGSSHSISYFSLTAGGALLALKLRDEFGGIAHLPGCHSMGCSNCDPFDNIAEALPERFNAGDTLVCVMAAGIVFRILAPYLKSKQDDPAVIVIDEEGGHVIPLLGGHAAGANALAEEVASFLGVKAAITTSSDVQGLIAPDDIARRLDAQVADPVQLRRVTALLVDGRPVCIEAFEDPGIDGYGWVPYGGDTSEYEGRLLVSHLLEPDGDPADGQVKTARLIPRKVTAGIGCKRGTGSEAVMAAIVDSCAGAGIDPRAIGVLSSIDIKNDEAGLEQAAKQLGARMKFYSAEDLTALGCPGNDFVDAKVGTPAVCEPAALLAAGDDASLLLEKTKHGPVTVALAISAGMQTRGADAKKDAAAGAGTVMVVGTGAGTESVLTAQAREAVQDADVVLGYHTYTAQLKKIFPGKQYIDGSMGAEMKRCREALDLAAAGKKVVLVSSGDPGVYGMAGPVLETANGFEVSIVPGVTAAQIAAARLGAPLMNDYIILSLSDLLTPRDVVLSRAEAAAVSDMVICLYNPTSKKRQPLFEEVCALLLRYRSAVTPAGWVRDAGGPDEESAIINLVDLPRQKIDMRTIVIVGNSSTEVISGRMVTRRGYERMSS